MDPETTLKDILADISSDSREDNREEIVENLENLANWIRKGGFLPAVERIGGSFKVA